MTNSFDIRKLRIKPISLNTRRLLLRQWKPADYEIFAAINEDTKVMGFFPAILTRAESDALANRCETFIAEYGWGLWAVEVKNTREFIGFVGLNVTPQYLPFLPCVEVGWRLAFQHWGKRFASEASREALRIGFEILNLPEIISFTSIHNFRSWSLMERLEMQRTATFQHPRVPKGSHLRQHYLYRLSREAWFSSSSLKYIE